MTQLTEFVAGRGPVEVYEDCWVPGSLEPFARSLAEIASPGDHVLDVGSGTGLLAQYASERVGDSGSVTALDPTPFMLEALRRKFDGSQRIDVIEGTIEDTALPGNKFDVLLCHQVVQYIGDLPKAFEQMRRVLKPSGTLGAGVWSGPQDQVMSVLEEGFREHLGDQFAPIHAWSFGGLRRLQDLAHGAGFKTRTLERQVKSMRFRSLEEMLYVHIAGGMRVVDGEVRMGIFDLDDVSYAPKVEALLEDLRKQLDQYEGPSGFEVPFASDVIIAEA